jgi:hypothetical protein
VTDPTQSSEHPIVSPELVLVDPELRALALSLLPDRPPHPPPVEAPAANGAAPALPPRRPARPHRVRDALLVASVVLNVIVLRFAWEDGISPVRVLGAEASNLPSVPSVPGPRNAPVPPSASVLSATASPRTAPSPKAVEARLIRTLKAQPVLRRRFVDGRGAVVQGVSARCSHSRPPRGFRCVVWRRPGPIAAGLIVDVDAGGAAGLRVAAVP